MTITYAEVLNAFQPAKEITDPTKFSGRKSEIEKGTQLLLTKDHAFIYGYRGIGKSSITRQIQLIASGNSNLLKDLESDLQTATLDYATCYLARDGSINNINQLLHRILIDASCFGQFPELHNKFGQTPNTYNLGPNLNGQLVADFWARASYIASKHEHGLAIFIDEFEAIKHHDGFASLLKAGREGVVFIITGIGSTETELIRDHSSIGRQLSTGKIPLPPMTPEELLRVIKTAEKSINHEICFTENAALKLAEIAHGQPYLLHLIGRQALLAAYKDKKNKVDSATLETALSQVAKEQVASELETRYLKAIGDSPQREIVLRQFAESCSPKTHTSDVYPTISKAGVTNPSYYTGDLQKVSFGSEIRKDAEKYYSFKDPLFQAYIKATPPRLGKINGTKKPKLKAPEKKQEILHFSDVHFGDKHYFSAIPAASDRIPETDKPTFESTIIDTIKREGITPSLMVISGDFTHKGTTPEFNKAHASINSIIQYFQDNELPEPRLVTCPGNHDVNWESAKSDPEARYLAYQAYVAFKNKLLNSRRIESGIDPERIYDITTLDTNPGILCLSLNSTVVENSSDHRGYIGHTQIQNALREIEGLTESNNHIRIAVFHHHLVPVHSTDMSIKAEDVMADTGNIKQNLHNAGFSLALHGHRHQGHAEQITSENGNQLLIIGCGSSGVEKSERGEQPLQFNRITITEKKQKIEVELRVYQYDAQQRSWTVPSKQPIKFFSFTPRKISK